MSGSQLSRYWIEVVREHVASLSPHQIPPTSFGRASCGEFCGASRCAASRPPRRGVCAQPVVVPSARADDRIDHVFDVDR